MQNFKTLASKTKELLTFKVKKASWIDDRASRIARAEILAYIRSLHFLNIKSLTATVMDIFVLNDDVEYVVHTCVRKNRDIEGALLLVDIIQIASSFGVQL